MRERHPIQDDAPSPSIDSLVREVHLLKCHLSQLWDQVWWMNLPWYRRLWYRLPRINRDKTTGGLLFWKGHRDPIKRFYL